MYGPTTPIYCYMTRAGLWQLQKTFDASQFLQGACEEKPMAAYRFQYSDPEIQTHCFELRLTIRREHVKLERDLIPEDWLFRDLNFGYDETSVEVSRVLIEPDMELDLVNQRLIGAGADLQRRQITLNLEQFLKIKQIIALSSLWNPWLNLRREFYIYT